MNGQRSVALPMYLSNRAAVLALWPHLRQQLEWAGCNPVPLSLDWPPNHLSHGQDPQPLLSHWQDPELLLSQACGYPLTHALADRVQLVGAFCYDAPGCEGVLCRSQLVARQEHAGRPLAEFRGLRAAFNSKDSQSGYNALRAAIAPLALNSRFFDQAMETGSHAASLQAVQQHRADLAAIDCVTFAGLKRDMPHTVEGLCVVGQTQPYTGLPLVTARDTSAGELSALRTALAALVRDPAAAPALEALGIRGFETLPPQSYQVCVDMRLQAEALGYPALA